MSELKPLYSVEETLRIQTTKLNQQLNKLLEQNAQIIELTVERDNALAQNAELVAYAADAERWFNKHDPNGYVSPKRELVKQHLRDHDAEVIMAVAKFHEEKYGDRHFAFGDSFRQYAEKVRRGEV